MCYVKILFNQLCFTDYVELVGFKQGLRIGKLSLSILF